MSKPIVIQREGLDSSVVAAFIAALNAELDARYPEEGANFFHLDPAEVAPGRGAMLVAYVDGEALGCGAIRSLDDADDAQDAVEVKRMYVAARARGLGVGRALLAGLEEEARKLGRRRVLLETGERQHEAIRLYERAGYARIPRFGDYLAAPLSVCMGKDLTPT